MHTHVFVTQGTLVPGQEQFLPDSRQTDHEPWLGTSYTAHEENCTDGVSGPRGLCVCFFLPPAQQTESGKESWEPGFPGSVTSACSSKGDEQPENSHKQMR